VFAGLWFGHWAPLTADQMPVFLGSAKNFWALVLLGYCAVASVLPVWVLLQPRDYINSLQLIVSLGLVFVGLFITAVAGFPFAPGHPSMALEISAPALNAAPLNAPPIFPFLFVTYSIGGSGLKSTTLM
ncbi:MAG: hypothetical protein NC937_04005, partial [Candidatus Omnitrophica bacterium]|nr:hypothetical protein [Candidatus Omnitrophota bacterium]